MPRIYEIRKELTNVHGVVGTTGTIVPNDNTLRSIIQSTGSENELKFITSVLKEIKLGNSIVEEVEETTIVRKFFQNWLLQHTIQSDAEVSKASISSFFKKLCEFVLDPTKGYTTDIGYVIVNIDDLTSPQAYNITINIKLTGYELNTIISTIIDIEQQAICKSIFLHEAKDQYQVSIVLSMKDGVYKIEHINYPAGKNLEAILIYNQFPRVWDMNFAEMTGYLQQIKNMGFNVVWVNPFFKTSETPHVWRVDECKGESVIHAKRSLYAMSDPSLIYNDTVEPSSGNPSIANTTLANQVKAYTQTAKAVGLIPIFDLVLNHVSLDSPLVKGEFSHFKDQDIDTKTWFRPDARWDDVKAFNYDDETIRNQIFEHLWKPFITKTIRDLGFAGVRVDYGTAVNQVILTKCVELIKTLTPLPIIFGECLVPTPAILDKDISQSKETGFTHLTNAAAFLSDGQVREGKEKYQWFLHDLGKKNAITHSNSSFRSGTIGFPGSHDAGTAVQVGISVNITEGEKNTKASTISDNVFPVALTPDLRRGIIVELIAVLTAGLTPQQQTQLAEFVTTIKTSLLNEDSAVTVAQHVTALRTKMQELNISFATINDLTGKLTAEHVGERVNNKKMKIKKELATGRIVDEQISPLNEANKLYLAKKRIAIAALTSNAGWYLMAGDEKLSTITKSPFVKVDDSPFGEGHDNMAATNENLTELTNFITAVNTTFKTLRVASKIFWVDIFFLDDEQGICFVRYLSDQKSPIDIVVVNLSRATNYTLALDGNMIKAWITSKGVDINWGDPKLKYYFVN